MCAIFFAERPSRNKVFVGRSKLLHDALRQLNPDKPTKIVTLAGPAGIGKSAIAMEIYHRISLQENKVPVFYVSLLGCCFFEQVYQKICETIVPTAVLEEGEVWCLKELVKNLKAGTVIILDNRELFENDQERKIFKLVVHNLVHFNEHRDSQLQVWSA